MKILALGSVLPGADPEKIKAAQKEEVRHVWEWHRRDVIREMYFRTDKPGAVFVLESASVEEARRVIDTFPLVASGLIDFELIPLGHFYGLAALFQPEAASHPVTA